MSVNHCTLAPVYRCWKALRSWTTVCCSGSTTWTRQRGRGRWRALRAAAMRRGPWPSRRPCTPQQWSPSKEELPAEEPSTLTTREFSQRNKRLLAKELGDKCYCWHLKKGNACLRRAMSCYINDNKLSGIEVKNNKLLFLSTHSSTFILYFSTECPACATFHTPSSALQLFSK